MGTQILKRVSTRRSFSYIQSLSCHHSLVLVITTEEEGKADQEGKKGGWKENEREQGEKEMLSFTSMGWPQDRNTQGDRECRNACGWIKYQQQGGWAATGVQRNTFCECPSPTECRYSHTDTSWGVAVYTCNTEGFLFPGSRAKRSLWGPT